ncbi:MAG: LemA family protein [Bacilli bacterium]|nr:LemA family protein [Bacilli bacterium]
MKHKKLIFTIIVIAIGLIYIILSSNQKLYTKRENINNEYSNILIEIENKLENVNKIIGYSDNTKEVKGIDKEIKKIANTHNLKDKLELNDTLDSKVNALIIQNADKKELKDNYNYKKLLERLNEQNDKIHKIKTKYNDKVKEYNKIIDKFPNNLIAKIFNYKKETKLI